MVPVYFIRIEITDINLFEWIGIMEYSNRMLDVESNDIYMY